MGPGRVPPPPSRRSLTKLSIVEPYVVTYIVVAVTLLRDLCPPSKGCNQSARASVAELDRRTDHGIDGGALRGLRLCPLTDGPLKYLYSVYTHGTLLAGAV